MNKNDIAERHNLAADLKTVSNQLIGIGNRVKEIYKDDLQAQYIESFALDIDALSNEIEAEILSKIESFK